MASKQEIKYIAYSIGFATFWFIIALPWIINKFDGNNPYFQFIFFNVGLIVFFQLVLKSMTLKTKIPVLTSIGLVCIFLALDTLAPEYHVTISGALVPGDALLSFSTTDYIWGLIGTSLGLKGFMVYLFTYILVPFALLYTSAKILPNFVRNL